MFDDVLDMDVTVDHNVLGEHLDAVESAMQQFGKTLTTKVNKQLRYRFTPFTCPFSC
ncbi:MAG: hypothetical protein R3C10_04630 [Pirellulales bacterium]